VTPGLEVEIDLPAPALAPEENPVLISSVS
jgi:hypothetical protein